MKQIVTFHGAEHKAGCTMVAQSVAEAISAGWTKSKVLFAALCGRKNAQFISCGHAGVDDFRMQIVSGVGVEKDQIRAGNKGENLFLLAGVEREEEARLYFPEAAEELLESLAEDFDVIIVDSGCEADDGLSLGALKAAGTRIMVFEQAESSLARYERMNALHRQLGMEFDRHIVNKYQEEDLYTLGYIAARLGLGRPSADKVGWSALGRQAEMERKTLLEYKSGRFQKDIERIAVSLSDTLGLGEMCKERKKGWKRFM